MKRIAVTMGEPGGIGPEVALRALEALKGSCIPVLLGDPALVEDAIGLIGLPVSMRVVAGPEDAGEDTLSVIDTGGAGNYKRGKPTADGGRAAASAIKKAVELAVDKRVAAIVTAPISKEALRMAGHPWPGHTEMLAELTGAKDYRMMLASGGTAPSLRIILVTIHEAIRDVPGLITKERVSVTIKLAMRACRMLGIEEPRIAVAALNPHAGEAGMFGDEEMNIISPAVKEAIRKGIPVAGPYPPDTLFWRVLRGEFDIAVCMYHDQGLIPLKMVAFDTGVNVTVGLPIIRTSPDHGTAYDIAWTGEANPASMIEAVRMALRLKSV